MDLQAQLDAERQRRLVNDAVRAAYEETVLTLRSNGFLPSVLAEEAQFPDFVLPNSEGRLVSLTSLLARGPVLVQFFRGEWCPYCRIMLDTLVEYEPAIKAAGASLIALTPDTGSWVGEAKTAHGAQFDILADVDCGVGLSAGVMFRVPPLYRARLLAAGIDFADRHGNHAWTLPVPAMFLLDRDGKVAWRFVDVDFTRRATPALILSALRTLTGSG